MRRTVSPPRVVIDTGLVLSALVFARGRLAPLRHAWRAHRIQPLISRATTAELIRVLAYPKFKLSANEQHELLADYLPCCETVRIPEPPPATPDCRDPFDVPFLQLALAGRAEALLTGDRELLALSGSFACPILGAEEFLQTLHA
ncbi:putative toxin-antitoxin system toxin component, PIN family [Accumulibacter sp.]|jgi:putative PIN family toxin of toxin-antitoxin system|uniref:putative toxin-antitoxin system toxin component, PIN family n=1 Tax=Accumulibacter sp. TaxID=2053492 RepID=UPI001AC90188|nr:putative toxin-antitoxin system toxin component, PIN family [Accumulibacter sp.]MBN8455937.1 putative toxin-antitoxin system toxin component, PIN family [Accumulibacter sp.]